MGSLDLWRRNVSPFRDDWFTNMDKMMEEWLGRMPAAGVDTSTWNPRCEVSESDMAFNFKFDLPGVAKDQIKVDLHDNRLTVSGERREEKKEEDKKRHYSEVFYGSFMRSFTFPTPVNAERVEAKYDAGVLNITVPKDSNGGARQISVK